MLAAGPAQQNVHGDIQGFAQNIPQCLFHGAQGGDLRCRGIAPGKIVDDLFDVPGVASPQRFFQVPQFFQGAGLLAALTHFSQAAYAFVRVDLYEDPLGPGRHLYRVDLDSGYLHAKIRFLFWYFSTAARSRV